MPLFWSFDRHKSPMKILHVISLTWHLIIIKVKHSSFYFYGSLFWGI